MPHKINHIAIAVNNLDDALGFWRDALGLPLERTEDNVSEGVRIGFLPLGESEIELMQPLGPETPVGKSIEKRGAGLHHICLEVADIRASMAHLEAAGVTLINPTPQTRPEGTLYCFIHPKSTGGVLVELYELAKGE